MNETIITKGLWGNIPWQFISDHKVPDIDLCTAAFCIVTFQGKLIIVKHKSRGYEFTGGHVDTNEEITKTVIREVREESRAIINNPNFFGYKKISPHGPILHQNKKSFYPFPHSYVPYYYAEATHFLESESLAGDIEFTKLVTYKKALELLQPDHNHDKILNYLLEKKLIVLK